ncbi:DNA circularization N-terminal domain-containing protein [Janthinobacterium sp.]|uniref:DNA circularization N-terminal domain-containing protein n=1 Tax=Janthinobacterium sp. TaxID=1871054 RepID=UPI00293D48CF|nr:DNA circularization N-terminal domain-containing protein [Janthinobacterium sp.]
MSIDTALGNIKSLTNHVQTGLGTLTRIGADLGLGGVGGTDAAWMDQLHPASYRGVPFCMLGGDGHFGRRNAVHEYPFRDTVWVEDMGRSARRINVTGFLVGDDCIAQRDRMIAVCEQDGDALLMHPTYGLLNVNLLGALAVTERWDKGRMFEISLSFIESGAREFPDVEAATGDAVNIAADATDVAAAGDFAARAGAALKNGAAIVASVVSTAQTWAATAQRLANDATNLHNLVGGLAGNFGRFAGGRNIGGLGGAVSALAGAKASAGSLIALGSAARGAVSMAGSALSSIASGLGL